MNPSKSLSLMEIDTSTLTFSDPDVQRCPFAAYDAIREQGPVFIDPVYGFYIVTNYDLVRKVLNDTDTFSSVTGQLLVQDSPEQAQINAIFEEDGYIPVNVLVVSDPPEHNYHRPLVDKAFTPGRVRQMEDYLASIVDSLIDEVIDDGQVEFYDRIANALPLLVIADQIGVPREDIEDFKRWSRDGIQQAEHGKTLEERLAITRSITEVQRYIVAKAQEYRLHPRSCMLSDLVNAEVEGRHLTMAELVSIVLQLLVAGNDTTTSVLSSCIVRIIQHPGLEDTLRSNPSIIPDFVEEVLRMDAPVQGLWRRATCDTELGGASIPKGALLVPKFAAANRDPARFEHPETFDMKRRGVRQHLTFGGGRHHCIGNQLARGELRVAITKILSRVKNIRLTRGEASVEYISHIFSYGPTRLEISFDRI